MEKGAQTMHLTQGLHRSLRSAPDSLATISGDRVRTVAEHADRVSRLAGAFRALGVSDGDRIGIPSQNSDRYAEALLAIPWANSIVVPLNIRWNEREISYALNDSETSMLIVDDGLASLALSVRHDTPELRHVVHAGEAPAPSGMVAYET
jgi:acyl-CoA synthetase (AMP-forming)/AMP-acid ligase II